MDKNELIKTQADYYLDNDVTMKQAADYFRVSKKTFQINMKKLETIDLDRYNLVQDKKERNLSSGAIKGGRNGKPTIKVTPEGDNIATKPLSISDDDIIGIAEDIIANKWTIREASMKTGISKSTLYDNLTMERLGDELYNKYSSTLEFNKMNTNKDVPRGK